MNKPLVGPAPEHVFDKIQQIYPDPGGHQDGHGGKPSQLRGRMINRGQRQGRNDDQRQQCKRMIDQNRNHFKAERQVEVSKQKNAGEIPTDISQRETIEKCTGVKGGVDARGRRLLQMRRQPRESNPPAFASRKNLQPNGDSRDHQRRTVLLLQIGP
jgi:hypothetical protein